MRLGSESIFLDDFTAWLNRDRIKEGLRIKYADLANDFARRLHTISSELAAIEGPLEVSFVLPLMKKGATHIVWPSHRINNT